MLNIITSSYKTMTRKELFDVPITPRGGRSTRWQGLQHGELVDTITRALKDLFGFVPMNEVFCTSPNGAALIGGFELGKQMKNSKTVEPVLMCSQPQEVGAAIGFSHSNDSQHQLSVAGGGRVFLCTNGVVSGEEKFNHKHTIGLKLFDWIIEGLQRFWDKLTSSWKKVDEMKEHRVEQSDHDQMLLSVGRGKILHWRLLGELDRIWREATTSGKLLWLPEGTNPDQWGFGATLWDWYNAVTHLVKKLSPRQQLKSLRKAMFLCQSYANLT